MASYSKMLADGVFVPLFQAATKTGLRKAISLVIVAAIAYLIRKRSMKISVVDPKLAGAAEDAAKNKKKKSKGSVDAQFIKRVMKLIRIAIPSWKSREAANILGLTIALVLRTFLSIYLASINGAVVKAIVNTNFKAFVSSIVFLGLFSIPASTVNSSMDYFNKNLTLLFRDRLTQHFNSKYLDKMIYYQI